MEILKVICLILGFIVVLNILRQFAAPFNKIIIEPLRTNLFRRREAQKFDKKVTSCRSKLEKTNWQQIEYDLKSIKTEVKTIESISLKYAQLVKIATLKIESTSSLESYLLKTQKYHHFLKDPQK